MAYASFPSTFCFFQVFIEQGFLTDSAILTYELLNYTGNTMLITISVDAYNDNLRKNERLIE
jgi:hypothetical protein